jgi:hypothetical protein
MIVLMPESEFADGVDRYLLVDASRLAGKANLAI